MARGRALDALRPGAVLELLSTDAYSWWELPAWLEVNGVELLERHRGWWRLRRSYRFLIRGASGREAREEGASPVGGRAAGRSVAAESDP